MIGFTAALAIEALTGAGLWQQLYFAPYAYFSAYLLVVVAAQLNKAFGRPQKGSLLPMYAQHGQLRGQVVCICCSVAGVVCLM